MNKQVRFALAVCFAVGATFVVTARDASAQILESLKVNLPETVLVGGVTLPAGHYTIHDVGKDNGSTVLMIHSDAGLNASVIAEPIMARPDGAEQTKVVLRHDSHGYSIDKIWIAGEDMGYHIVALTLR